MKTMKKIISFVLISLIFLSQFLSGAVPAIAAVSQGVGLDGYDVSKTSIYTGDEFGMMLRVRTYTENITDIYISIDSSSSFSIKNSGSTLPVNISTADTNVKTTDLSTFIYNGGSNRLEVTIKYKIDGVSSEQSDFITISQAKPKDDTPSTPVDTAKYAPKIVIAGNSSIPSGKIGSQITYTLPLKNNSSYSARNITISPVLDDSTPIVMESMNISQTVESMQPNETKEIKFNFKISTGSAVKTYPIKFNIQYYNYSNDYYSSTETGYLKTETGSKLPKLELETVTTNPSPVHAGENFKLDLALKNGGTVTAKNVSVTLLGLKNDGASIIGTTNKLTKSSVPGGSTSIFSYDLAASSKIETGANSLKVKLDYSDATGSTFSDEIEFFFNVQSSGSQTAIQLKNMVSPDSALTPGSNASITFDAANTGTADAYNVKVSISSDKEIIPRTLNTIIFPVLKKGETKNVQFQLFVSDDAVTKNYPVAINVEYDNNTQGTGTKQTLTQYVGLYVENASGKSVPRLIIDKYDFSPEILKAGQQFTLDLSILNTSKSSPISNIKVSLTSDDGTFTTVDSNSFYIESIPPKGKVQKKVSFSSKSDAAAKQYMISVNYEYEDEKGNPYTNKDVIGIPLQQPPRLVLGDINFPPEAYVGNPVPINLSFFNMGKSTLYNLMVKVEGNFRVEGSSYFVGNFEPGKTDSFDGNIVPEAAGSINGTVIFTYEDADGKSQEVKKEIALTAMEMPVQKEFPGEGNIPPAEQKNKIPLWALIGCGVILVGIVVTLILFIRKKIKARKEFMFDEEL